MIQTILLILVFAFAVLYLGRRLYRQYTHSNTCGGTGCAKCGTNPVIKSPDLQR